MKKSIIFILCLSALITFSGCGNKEDTKTEKTNNEVVSQETEKAKTENNSIVGIWVVEKTEMYDGPMKDYFKKEFDMYYYPGAEWEYTEDKIIYCKDTRLSTSYRLLSDTEMEVISVNEGKVMKQEYELKGDTLIQYGLYEGDFSKYGRANATYYKRK